MAKHKYRYTTTAYMGETSRGVPNAVFWDPHAQIANGNPPVTFASGAPGSGKTNFAMTAGAISALCGKTTIIIDWKGDFLNLKNLEKEIGPVRVWALGGGGSRGSLDPFYMSDDPQEKLRLAMDVIGMFLGGVENADVRQIPPIVNDVIQDKTKPASLSRVVAMLRGSENEHARGIGAQLHLVSQMNHAQICFAPGGERPPTLNLEGGTTVATLYGLELPATQADALKDNSSRLASGIFYLLTDYIRRVMKASNTPRPKTLIIDEAWAILATEAGARITKEVSLLGRSKKLAMILATQNYDHIEGKGLDNTIGTRFAFRAEPAEAEQVVKGLGLNTTEGFDNLISDLDTGECLMRDWEGNYSTVQIEQWRPDWAKAFNTNPFL